MKSLAMEIHTRGLYVRSPAAEGLMATSRTMDSTCITDETCPVGVAARWRRV